MTGKLTSRTAIITGSSSGIGRAIALTYAREGAFVVCADLSPSYPSNFSSSDNTKAGGETTLDVPTHELIGKNGGQAIFVKTDVEKEDDLKEVIKICVERWGRLDIMVNNAGIAPDINTNAVKPGGTRIHETETETFDRVMSINARGVFLGSKHAITQFLSQPLSLNPNSRGDRPRGWIVNTASAGGTVAFPGAPSYITSKYAVVGLTKQIALDYGREKIHCNALCPGFVDTPLVSSITRDEQNPLAVGLTKALVAAHPWGTLGTPEDIAGGALFLVSEESQFVTGLALVIDGGYTLG